MQCRDTKRVTKEHEFLKHDDVLGRVVEGAEKYLLQPLVRPSVL